VNDVYATGVDATKFVYAVSKSLESIRRIMGKLPSTGILRRYPPLPTPRLSNDQ